jgi:integrase
MRGDGFVFKRGNRWWIGYNVAGKFNREPCGKDVTTRTEAKAALRVVHEALNKGTYLAPVQRRVTVGDLLDELLVYLKNRGAASVKKVESHLQAVRKELGQVRAVDLTTAAAERYQRMRLEAGKAPATVNRECEALRQALRRAARLTPPKIPAAPHIPLLRVDNARQGFLARADFEALLPHFTDPGVRDFVEWFFWTAMRPGEIRQLTWSMLDRETWTLQLDPKADKTRRGRVLAIAGPLRKILDRRLTERRLDSPLIFHRVSRVKGREVRPGQPIKDFRLQWRKVLAAAGVAPGLLPYDLRRTALRNMVRGGTDYTVAMKISGHRTRSTFDRYNITSVEDIRAAVERTADYVATLPTERNVSTIEDSQKTHSRAAHRKAR